MGHLATSPQAHPPAKACGKPQATPFQHGPCQSCQLSFQRGPQIISARLLLVAATWASREPGICGGGTKVQHQRSERGRAAEVREGAAGV